MRKQAHYGDAAWLRWLHWALSPVSRVYGWLLQASLVWQYRWAHPSASPRVEADDAKETGNT